MPIRHFIPTQLRVFLSLFDESSFDQFETGSHDITFAN